MFASLRTCIVWPHLLVGWLVLVLVMVLLKSLLMCTYNRGEE